MFKHDLGRVRQATVQEDVAPGPTEPGPRVAGGIIWMINFVNLLLLVVTILCTRSWDGEETDPTNHDSRDGLRKVKAMVKDPVLQAYMALALFPFCQFLCFNVLLTDSRTQFCVRDYTAILLLFVSHLSWSFFDFENVPGNVSLLM